MADYEYTGTTEQSGTAHQNVMVALKVDPAATPPVEVLATTTADINGDFALSWGTSSGTEEWTGRVCIGALDDDGTVKLEAVFHDFLVGVEAEPPIPEEGYHMTHHQYVEFLGADHYWVMDDNINTVMCDYMNDYYVVTTGTKNTMGTAIPDPNGLGHTTNDGYTVHTGLPAGTVLTLFGLFKTTVTTDQCFMGTGNNSSSNVNGLRLTSDTFGLHTDNSDLYGISGANALIADGKWHCFIFEIHDSAFTSTKLWIDGRPQTLSQVTGTSLNRTLQGNIYMQGDPKAVANANKFNGDMARWGVISGALTDDEATRLNMALFSGSMDTRVPVDNLVASYSGGAYLGTDLYDEAKGNVATLSGTPTHGDGPIGKLISFDGVDDCVDIPALADFGSPTEVGYSVWASLEVVNQAGAALVTERDDGGADEIQSQIGFRSTGDSGTGDTASGGFLFFGQDDAGWLKAVNPVETRRKDLVHIVGTYIAGDYKLYVDGVLVHTQTAAFTAAAGDAFYWGRSAAAAGVSYFSGKSYGLRIYSRGLTQEDVDGLYKEGSFHDPRRLSLSEEIAASSPHGWVDMDVASGASVMPDLSGNGYDGTITGSPTLGAEAIEKSEVASFEPGAGDWISFSATDYDLDGDIAIEMYVASTATGTERLLHKYTSGSGVRGYSLYLSSGKPDVSIGNGGGSSNGMSIYRTVNDGIGHQIVLQRVANLWTMFVDGYWVGKTTLGSTGTISAPSEVLRLATNGSGYWASNTSFGNFAIYATGLSRARRMAHLLAYRRDLPFRKDVLAKRPVAFLELDDEDTTVTGTAHDSSGNGHHGTRNNTATKSPALRNDSRLANSFVANGDAGGIELEAHVDTNGWTGFTIEVWFNADSGSSEYGIFCSEQEGGVGYHGVTFEMLSDGKLELTLFSTSTATTFTTVSTFDDNAVHHAVAKWSDSGDTKPRIYVDDVIEHTGTAWAGPLNSTGYFRVGDHQVTSGSPNPFTGELDTFILFDYELTAAEHSEDYTNGLIV